MSLPRSLTFNTRSIEARIFWSGAAAPLSKSATMDCVVLHLVARSFCVIFGSIFCRDEEMTSPTAFPTVLGLMISSDLSTLVRRWPSGCEPCWMTKEEYQHLACMVDRTGTVRCAAGGSPSCLGMETVGEIGARQRDSNGRHIPHSLSRTSFPFQ